jgi:hypothetical protein
VVAGAWVELTTPDPAPSSASVPLAPRTPLVPPTLLTRATGESSYPTNPDTDVPNSPKSSILLAMARPKQTSRITPKGTRPHGASVPNTSVSGDNHAPSPGWLGWFIGMMFLAGLVLIVANYLSWLPSSPKSAWILVGLGFVLGGILSATRWH